jgi:signal transduction histidine kinase
LSVNYISVPKKILFFLITLSFCYSCNYNTRNLPVSSPGFDSVISRAERIYDSGYKEKALAFAQYAHSHSRGLTVADEMNYYTYVSGIYRKDFKRYDKYLLYADSMLDVLDKNDAGKILPFRYVQAYNMKGDALFAKGLYNESYDYYYKAKALAKSTFDSCSLGHYSYSLGMVLYRQQRYHEAALYFLVSFNESKACIDNFLYFYRSQELLDNIGLSYFGAKNYDSALYFYNKALAYIDSNYMRFGNSEKKCITAKAVIYGNLGNLYIAQNKFGEAEELLKKSISINLQKGYTNGDALIEQVKLANLFYRQENMAGMKDLLNKIKVELDTLPDKNVELSWNKLMWQYHEHEKDSARAYRYVKAYQAMNDSFLARNHYLLTSDIDDKIKNIEHQNRIDLLKKDNEQERMYLLVAVLVAVMALVIVALVSKNAKRSMKSVAMLTNLNNKINEQNEKLELALAELELRDKDKTRILRSVAHDVMNPIASIISLSEIIISESANYSEEHREILSLIKEACHNSHSLSKDILQAAATVDPSNMEKEWVDMTLLVSNSVKLLSVQAKAKKQRLIFTSKTPQINAYVNKKKMWRLINNLVVNAIKFSFEHTEIRIDLELNGNTVNIDVTDQGIGIPEKNKAYVFDMFTDVKIPGTSGEVPHGLGLSICLQIAKSHGGNIWFESEEGKGTTFHVAMPVNFN